MLRLERVALGSSFLLWTLVVFLLLSLACSKIPLGSRLSAGSNSYWTSANGNFAIGFFRHSGEYNVGIKFNSSSIPDSEQTVVWSVGANGRVGKDSYFELNKRGELVLFDSASRGVVWTSDTSNAAVESAFLRDDGNFILIDRNNNVVWQSFSYPSDTLLPGQNLTAGNGLRASSRNSIASVYTLTIDVSGQLQLRWETSVIYWTKGNPSDLAFRALLGSEGVLQLLNRESKYVWSVYGEDHNDSNMMFRFLRLDSDGNLRLYSWRNETRTWKSVWQAFENQCEVFATCGLRGICTLDSSGSHVCKCPFSNAPEEESTSDCLVPYDPNCASEYSIVRYDDVYLYGVYPLNETIVQTSLQRCQTLCEDDLYCYAVTFINNGSAQCRIKKSQYIGGWSSRASSSSISFVKTCSRPVAVFPSPKQSIIKTEPKQETCAVCVTEVSLASVLAFILIQLGIGTYIIQRRKRYIALKSGSSYSMPNTSSCVMLSYSEIEGLTGDFKDQIRPTMFKGVMSDNRVVVVKRLNPDIDARKFRAAVAKLGSVSHKNLSKLNAYCCDPGQRFLVYEYSKNGTLDKCLEDSGICRELTWRKRMSICIGVARALSYLHTGCREFITHGDLKCENVVLDEEFEAKVIGFGTRVFEGHDNAGSAETDVLDFSRMMVVLITGHRNPDDAFDWAYQKWLRGELDTVSDTRIEGGVDLGELERVLRLSFWCFQGDERMRPSMGEVVQVLEGKLPVDPPPPLRGETLTENNLRSSPTSSSSGS